MSQKLILSTLGIVLEGINKNAVITKLMFFNSNNCYDTSITVKTSSFGEFKIQIDENNKIHISKSLSEKILANFNSGILTHLIKISNDECIGVITYKDVDTISIIKMDDIIGKKIFS